MAKLEELMENEEFITKLLGAEEDELDAVIKEYELDNSNVKDIELSEEQLDGVSGGAITIVGIWYLIQLFTTSNSLRKNISKLYKSLVEIKKYGYPKTYQEQVNAWFNKYMPPSY